MADRDPAAAAAAGIAPGLAPAPRRGREYWTIQSLRFVAALAVVVLHAIFYAHERLDPRLSLYPSGANGVRLFFVISGFVMVMSSERLLGRADGWRVFAVKRVQRIVPLYWSVLLFKLAVMLAAPGVVLHARIDWGYIVKSFLFIPATNVDVKILPLLGVGWTLNFEMFFYALFAAALLVRIRPLLFIAPILVALSALSFVRSDAWPVPLYFLCDPIVLDFLAGMLIARWCQAGRALGEGKSWFAVTLGLLILFVPFAKPDYYSLAGSLLMTFAASLVVVGATSLEPRVGARLPRFALVMGAASYSLYLVHPLIAPGAPAVFAKAGLALPWLAVTVSVAIALVAGWLCYRFVETPLTRLVGRRPPAPDPVVAADGAAANDAP